MKKKRNYSPLHSLLFLDVLDVHYHAVLAACFIAMVITALHAGICLDLVEGEVEAAFIWQEKL